MDIMDAINGCRTIRAFKHEPISEDTIAAILEAATWAPSHQNERPPALPRTPWSERIRDLP